VIRSDLDLLFVDTAAPAPTRGRQARNFRESSTHGMIGASGWLQMWQPLTWMGISVSYLSNSILIADAADLSIREIYLDHIFR
jgi:hypothetical protein